MDAGMVHRAVREEFMQVSSLFLAINGDDLVIFIHVMDASDPSLYHS